jgi:anaerobic selenocysteine-containing dehydrogenase
VDLGPLEPRLPGRLQTRDRRVALAPRIFLDDLPRLERRFPPAPAGALAASPPAAPGLVLIGRRQLRSNNSWMHNSERLVKGPDRCTLLIHPDDAAARGLATGGRAKVATRTGAIELPVEITADIMPGVISIPHGWGHGRAGARLRVAAAHPGASLNDITDDTAFDLLSGTSALTGLPVEVTAAAVALDVVATAAAAKAR